MLRLSAFSAFVLAGAPVLPELLRFVARRFQRYIDAGGKLTLDHAFSLRSRQRAGNPAKRMAEGANRDAALIEIALLRHTEGLTIEKAVSRFLDEHAEPEMGGTSSPVHYGSVTLSEESLLRASKSKHGRFLFDAQGMSPGPRRKKGK